MHVGQIEMLQGNNIEILKMVVEEVDNQLELYWEICLKGTFSSVKFYNVSRLRIKELSSPLEVHGFEIINHTKDGWEKDSTYEIRDFEYGRISFFCESIEIQNQ